MMSSNRGDWETPKKLFNRYNAIYNYTLDAAASEKNALCKDYFSVEKSAFDHMWTGNVWCNPPYGRAISDWVALAVAQKKFYRQCSLLLPARPDTKWFKLLWDTGDDCQVVFDLLHGRLKFCIDGKEEGTAPFPSMVVSIIPQLSPFWHPRKVNLVSL